jgi:hypothetical protein
MKVLSCTLIIWKAKEFQMNHVRIQDSFQRVAGETHKEYIPIL